MSHMCFVTMQSPRMQSGLEEQSKVSGHLWEGSLKTRCHIPATRHTQPCKSLAEGFCSKNLLIPQNEEEQIPIWTEE